MEKKTVLSNGIRILTEDIPHVHSAVMGLWVDTGSKNEEPEVWGISHFIEHMLFKGTTSRNAMQIAQELEDTGGSINAFTDKENTCFYARCLDSHLDKAIDVLTDIYLNSVFDPSELEKEKQVVLEELKMYEDAPDDVAYELMTEKLWENHPLGHKIVGTENTIKGFSDQKIRSYMEKNYTPNRLVVSVAGNINPDEVVEKISAKLSNIKNHVATFEEPTLEYKKHSIARHKDVEQLHLCFSSYGPAIKDDNRFSYAIIDSILGGGMSSKLFQEIREKRGLAYSVSSFELLYRKGGIFGVYAGISPENFKETSKYILYELDKIREGNFTETDIRRAKEHLKGSLLLSYEAVRSRMSKMARNEIYFNKFVTTKEIIEEIEKVDYDQIVTVAKKSFDRKNMSLVAVGPVNEIPFNLEDL